VRVTSVRQQTRSHPPQLNNANASVRRQWQRAAVRSWRHVPGARQETPVLPPRASSPTETRTVPEISARGRTVEPRAHDAVPRHIIIHQPRCPKIFGRFRLTFSEMGERSLHTELQVQLTFCFRSVPRDDPIFFVCRPRFTCQTITGFGDLWLQFPNDVKEDQKPGSKTSIRHLHSARLLVLVFAPSPEVSPTKVDHCSIICVWHFCILAAKFSLVFSRFSFRVFPSCF
jgi:hypothetical protein